MAGRWKGGFGCTELTGRWAGKQQQAASPNPKIQLRAFTDRRQTEVQLIPCNGIDFKFSVIFRARDPWPFHAAAGTAWQPLDALANVFEEFGGYSGSS